MTLNLLHPTCEIQIALQRALDLVAFGLQAADSTTPAELTRPNITVQLSAARDHALDLTTAREEFPTWILANGLRDAVEAVGPALEWARKICFLWTRQGAANEMADGKLQMTAVLKGEEWNKAMVAGASKFDRLPLPDKLKHLEGEFGLMPLELSGHILRINAARNCLAHRKGIVGLQELKDQDDRGLVVRRLRFQLSATSESGTRVLAIPATVNADEAVVLEFVEVEQSFALGEKVVFTAEEFLDLCFTHMHFALQVQEAIVTLQRGRLSQSVSEGITVEGHRGRVVAILPSYGCAGRLAGVAADAA